MAYFYGYKAGGVFKDQADVDAHPEMRLKNAAGVLQGGPGDYKIVDFNKDGNNNICGQDFFLVIQARISTIIFRTT